MDVAEQQFARSNAVADVHVDIGAGSCVAQGDLDPRSRPC